MLPYPPEVKESCFAQPSLCRAIPRAAALSSMACLLQDLPLSSLITVFPKWKVFRCLSVAAGPGCVDQQQLGEVCGVVGYETGYSGCGDGCILS